MIKKNIWLITFIVAVLIAVSSLVFIVVPNLLELNSKREQIRLTSEKNVTLSVKLGILDGYNLSDLQDKYQYVNLGLLPNKDAYRIFSSFDNALSILGENKLKLGSFQFEVGEVKDKSNAKIADLSLTLDVKGEASAAGELLKYMETSYPLMTVKTLDLKVDSNATTIGFVIHVFPEVSQIPSLETEIGNFSEKELKILEEILPFASILQNENELKYVESGRVDPFEN